MRDRRAAKPRHQPGAQRRRGRKHPRPHGGSIRPRAASERAVRTSCGRILAQSLPLAGEIVQQILLECRRIRTSDLRLQRPTLYPTELQPQSGESGRSDLNRRPLAPPNRRVTRLRHSPTAAIRRSCHLPRSGVAGTNPRHPPWNDSGQGYSGRGTGLEPATFGLGDRCSAY